ncbi:MAG TPA: DUF169 domain-containing protein [Dehalococcoidia bacterium]|nr:DUF169 domain-containing protein [Dehalococcoidia bacterium]
MADKLTKEKVAELAKEIKERAHLTYTPVGISLIKSEAEIPEGARRPSERGQRWMECLAENIVRTMGWTIAMTMSDHFCMMAATGLGHIELPEYLAEGKTGAHHTKNPDIGKELQGTLEACFQKPRSTVGVMLTPATEPLFMPQGLVIYGNPSQIGKIAKGIAWYRGAPVPATAGGLAACVIAAWAITIDKKPRVILPCSGAKVFGHVEENDVFLATPVEELPDIVEGMKATDFILPYPTAKFMFFEPRMPKSYPLDYKTYEAWKAGKK